MGTKKINAISAHQEFARHQKRTESLEHDLLKMIHVLERERAALDSAILALEKVKRSRLAVSNARSRKV